MNSALDRITGGRVSRQAQWQARSAICKAVRGHEVGPRFRRGSNAFRGSPMWVAGHAPCPRCGGDGAELKSVGGREYCPSCREEWVIGDYDWEILADIVRYQKDKAAGLIEDPLEEPCPKCLTPIGEQPYARCDAGQCPVLPFWIPYLQPDIPSHPAQPPFRGEPAALADSMRRLGETLSAVLPMENGETVTVEEARRARFAEAAAEAAERDRRREAARR